MKYRITVSKYIPGSNENEGNKLFTASRDSREKAMVCSTMRTPAVDTIIWKSTWADEPVPVQGRWDPACLSAVPSPTLWARIQCSSIILRRSKVLAVFHLRHEHYTSWWPLLPWRTSKSVIPSFKNKACLPFQASYNLGMVILWQLPEVVTDNCWSCHRPTFNLYQLGSTALSSARINGTENVNDSNEKYLCGPS